MCCDCGITHSKNCEEMHPREYPEDCCDGCLDNFRRNKDAVECSHPKCEAMLHRRCAWFFHDDAYCERHIKPIIMEKCGPVLGAEVLELANIARMADNTAEKLAATNEKAFAMQMQSAKSLAVMIQKAGV